MKREPEQTSRGRVTSCASNMCSCPSMLLPTSRAPPVMLTRAWAKVGVTNRVKVRLMSKRTSVRVSVDSLSAASIQHWLFHQ